MYTQEQITLQGLLNSGAAKSSSFANDIAFKRLFTQKQHDWVNKLISEAQAPKPVTVKIDASRVLAMFALAGASLKQPKINLSVNGNPVRIKVATKKADGTLYIDGGSGDSYYGKIDPSGDIRLLREVPANLKADIESLILALAANPEKVAAEFGHLTGNCCFCNRDLSDDRSTDVGYGKICADKYGMEWGVGAVKTAEIKSFTVTDNSAERAYDQACERLTTDLFELATYHA
jgi:hypothetical protein